MAMAISDIDLAMAMAQNVAALSTVDALRGAAADVRIARNQAKLIYDSELERANEIFSNATLAAIDAYDRTIASLTAPDDNNDDEYED